jgi:transposase
MMPQKSRLVGLDVAKNKVDACIRSASPLRMSQPSTPEGQAQLVAWLRANRVGRAVMEASGGYERNWAEALRAEGLAVQIVDPKRIRHFAKAAGRLAKNDPIDADTIAWFAETFPAAELQPHDPAREEVDRLVTARAGLKEVEERIKQQREHRPPALVAEALAVVLKATRAELRKLEAAIAAKIKANSQFTRRAEIIDSFPGLGEQAVSGLIAWAPELGRISNQARRRPPRRRALRRRQRRAQRPALHQGRTPQAAQSSLYAGHGRSHPAQPGAQGLLPAPARQGQGGQGRHHRLHAQDDRHPQHHARARPDLEPASARPRMNQPSPGRRAAHRADRLHAKKTGERTGSRPKPPKAGARSASPEAGRAPGYRQTSQLHTPALSPRRASKDARLSTGYAGRGG